MRPYLLFLSTTLLIVGPVHAGTTSLAMTSQPGDYIGQGQSYTFTPADGTFLTYRGYVNSSWSNAAHIEFFTPGFRESWDLVFSAPNNALLVPGVYEGAIRVTSASSEPGLDVSGDGRGCNMLFGRFEVRQILYTGDGFGGIGVLWATFEQHCEFPTGPALLGEVRYNASVPTAVSRPSWGALKAHYH
jgi:hypothetical protein